MKKQILPLSLAGVAALLCVGTYRVALKAEALQQLNSELAVQLRSKESEYAILNDAYKELSREYNISVEYEPQHFKCYDVPLDEDLQRYIYTMALENNFDYRMVLAMIKKESNFDASTISSTNDYGLMQINKCNHAWLSKELGIEDFLDPYQNVEAGIHIISALYHKYGSYDKALMAYNMGESGASAQWSSGKTTSSYSSSILAFYKIYIEE